MSIRKVVLLASMALAAIAVAAPGGASALEWTHNHKTLVGHATVQLKGKVAVGTSAVGAIQCDVHATLTAEPPIGGTVTKYEITKDSCETSKIFANCKLINSQPTLPWEAGLTATGIEVTNATIHLEFEKNEKCSVGTKFNLTFPAIKVKTSNAKTISQVELEGKTPGMSPMEITGTLSVEPAATLGFS